MAQVKVSPRRAGPVHFCELRSKTMYRGLNMRKLGDELRRVRRPDCPGHEVNEDALPPPTTPCVDRELRAIAIFEYQRYRNSPRAQEILKLDLERDNFIRLSLLTVDAQHEALPFVFDADGRIGDAAMESLEREVRYAVLRQYGC